MNNRVEELIATYAADDQSRLAIIDFAKNGITFKTFTSIIKNFPFNLGEWSNYLHITERTIQRYKKENKTFNMMQSEMILEIAMLYRRGSEVFYSSENFNTWLEATSIALGGIRPKDLLESRFGLEMVNDELTRIEHGVLA